MLQPVGKEKAVLGVRNARAERTVKTTRDDLEAILQQSKRSEDDGGNLNLKRLCERSKDEEYLSTEVTGLRREMHQEEINRLSKELETLRAGNLKLKEVLRKSTAKSERLAESPKHIDEIGALRAHNLRLKWEVRRSLQNAAGWKRRQTKRDRRSKHKQTFGGLCGDEELAGHCEPGGTKIDTPTRYAQEGEADLEVKNRNRQ